MKHSSPHSTETHKKTANLAFTCLPGFRRVPVLLFVLLFLFRSYPATAADLSAYLYEDTKVLVKLVEDWATGGLTKCQGVRW